MKTFLLIVCAILIIVGGWSGFKYQKLREYKFNEKTNRYFVVSLSTLLVAATICIFEIGMVITELLERSL